MKYFKLYLPKLFQCKCDEEREGITMIVPIIRELAMEEEKEGKQTYECFR
jgi:hypothetical protein